MPTSSITKDFVVRDEAAFAKLIEEIKKAPSHPRVRYEDSSLKKGRDALKIYLDKTKNNS